MLIERKENPPEIKENDHEAFYYAPCRSMLQRLELPVPGRTLNGPPESA
jgi:hypothetical protein